MKRRITAIVLIAALMMCTIAGFAKDVTFNGSGSGFFVVASNSFDVKWGASGGNAGFGFYGPNMSVESLASSNGSMAGSFNVTAQSFKQGFNAIDASSLQSFASLPNGSFAALAFNGVGFVKIQINAGDLLGGTLMMCAFDADAFWIIMDIPEEEEEEEEEEEVIRPHVPAPILVFTAIGFKERKVRMVIENIGDAPTEETDANVFCGLSYSAVNWRSESCTHFKLETFEDVVIEPGQTVAFDFSMPTSIPQRQLNYFLNRRGLFTSYDYPNPTIDCFDFTLRVDGFSFHCFSPTTIRFE